MKAQTFAPVLETERLKLRAHTLADFDESAAMWADPLVVRFLSGRPSTTDTSWTRLLRYIGHWVLLGYGYWVVEAKQDGRFVGEVGFADFKRDIVPPLGAYPEAGWVLKSTEHGQGFGIEAVNRIMEWADGSAGFKKTVCILAPENSASMRIAVRAGFSNERKAVFGGGTVLTMSRENRS